MSLRRTGARLCASRPQPRSSPSSPLPLPRPMSAAPRRMPRPELHGLDDERPARLRRLADHEDRDPDARSRCSRSPRPATRSTTSSRPSSSSTSRSPTPTATRSPSATATVVYTANTPLPDGQRDTFELSFQVPDAEGETLAFPTIQTCEKGETGWIEVPGRGPGRRGAGAPGPVVRDPAGRARAATTTPPTARPPRRPCGRRREEARDDRATPTRRARLGRARAGVLGLVAGGTALARTPQDRVTPARDRRGGAGPRLAAAALVALRAGAGVGVARPSAHAELIGTDPVEGAVLDEAPDAVTLTFNEARAAHRAGDHGLRRRRRDGAVRRDRRRARRSPSTCPTPPSSADGTYVVAWNVLSGRRPPDLGVADLLGRRAQRDVVEPPPAPLVVPRR